MVDEARRRQEQGVVLIAVLMASILLMALATGLVVVTTTETLVSANYRSATEALFAAEAGAEMVMADLVSAADWSSLLAGGSPVSCPAGLSAGQPARIEPAAVWGPDDPQWRLRLCGRLDDLMAAERVESEFAVAVWISDDPADRDGQPSFDSNDVLVVRSEAFGPMGVHRGVETVVGRTAAGIRVVSWRAVL
jgi:hypothetical protein